MLKTTNLFNVCLFTTSIFAMESDIVTDYEKGLRAKENSESHYTHLQIKKPAKLKDIAYHRENEQHNGALLYEDGSYLAFDSQNGHTQLCRQTSKINAITLIKKMLITGTQAGYIDFVNQPCEPHQNQNSYPISNKHNVSKSAITSLAYSPQHEKIFIGTHKGKVKIWDITNETSTTISTHHNDPIKQVLPHPQNGLCTWITTDGSICFNDTRENTIHTLPVSIKPCNTQYRIMDFNTSGTTLCVKSKNYLFETYDFTTHKKTTLPIPTSNFRFCFVGEKTIISWNGNLQQPYYEIDNQQENATLQADTIHVEQSCFNRSFQELFTVGYQPDTNHIGIHFHNFNHQSLHHPLVKWTKTKPNNIH